MAAENKTKPTHVPIDDFLLTVGEKRADEARQLIRLMQDISGEKPVMWGPSIVGFGSQHYKSEAGREGDMPILGFSPRKNALTIYFYEGFDHYGEELSQLGKHTHSASCLYINKLDDIDTVIIEKMLRSSYAIATSKNQKKELTVDEYIAAIPAAARTVFDELRKIVREELPDAHEVMSYGIVGYKPDMNKRAVIFISGWKDHVAVYPIPKDEALRTQLAPYIRGQGTLWFALDTPLPQDLIRRTVKQLA